MSLTCKNSVAIESDTMLQHVKENVLKTYANCNALASMGLMRSLSEPLQLEKHDLETWYVALSMQALPRLFKL